MIETSPSTPVASQPEVRAVVLQHVRRRRLHTALGLSLAACAVVVVGAVVTGALSVTGTGSCAADESGDTICVKRTWWPFTIQQRAEQWTRNGHFDGPRMEWHKNGHIWFTGLYVHDQRVGPWLEYWDNGVTRFSGTYVDGELHGVERWFFPDGTLEWEVRRDHGERVGVERWYWPNGVLRREGRYVNGEKHGVFSGYSELGTPSRTVTYRAGVIVTDDA